MQEEVATLARRWEDSNLLSRGIGVTAGFRREHRGQEDGRETETSMRRRRQRQLPSPAQHLHTHGAEGIRRAGEGTARLIHHEPLLGRRSLRQLPFHQPHPQTQPWCHASSEEVKWGWMATDWGESDLQGEPPHQCSSCLPSWISVLHTRGTCYPAGGLYPPFPSLVLFPACTIPIDKAWRVPKQKGQLDSFSQGIPPRTPVHPPGPQSLSPGWQNSWTQQTLR